MRSNVVRHIRNKVEGHGIINENDLALRNDKDGGRDMRSNPQES